MFDRILNTPLMGLSFILYVLVHGIFIKVWLSVKKFSWTMEADLKNLFLNLYDLI